MKLSIEKEYHINIENEITKKRENKNKYIMFYFLMQRNAPSPVRAKSVKKKNAPVLKKEIAEEENIC